MKVIYEKHPVTPERKQQLRSQGYTILDARFAPAGYVHPDEEMQPAGSAGTDGQSAAGNAGDTNTGPALGVSADPVDDHQDDDNQPAAGDELESMTLDELKEIAKELGVRIHANSGADKFIEAIRAAGYAGASE